MIELRNAVKAYGDKTVLDNFSFFAEKGEFVALTGASGCGKSTLLNIIGLLEWLDGGELSIDGETGIRPGSARANKILREKISYLFQNFALVDEQSVAYNLQLALRYSGGSKTGKKEKMREALDYVGLGGYERKKIYQLSGGEQQRVAIARILLKPSEIILADEPTGSLDAGNRDVILEMLRQLRQSGKTIVVATHDTVVSRQCDRIVAL